MIEVRGVGLRRVDYGPRAVVRLIVELGAAEGVRFPREEQRTTDIQGIIVPRLAVALGVAALPCVLALLNSSSERCV